MGQMTRIMITGANGFIGRATVAAAKAAGFDVVPIVRTDVDLGSALAPDVLAKKMQGCSAVIHLAAAMGGSVGAHARDTIGGTRHVLVAMEAAGVPKLVLASSIAVYSLNDVTPDAPLSANSSIDTATSARDTYSAAKITQEQLTQDAEIASVHILRPGIVYGDNRLWNAHLGVGVGPVLLRFPDLTVLPMCHVDMLAQKLVQSVQSDSSATELLIDETLPTRRQVIERLRADGWPKLVLPFPWVILRGVAGVLSFAGSALPGLLRLRVLFQRMYPMGRISGSASALEWSAQ